MCKKTKNDNLYPSDEPTNNDADDFSFMGSSDDTGESKMCTAFKKVTKEIECRNKVIAALRAQIAKLVDNEDMSCVDMKIVSLLQNRLEQESRKVKNLTNRALHLQICCSKRRCRNKSGEPTDFEETDMGMKPHLPSKSRSHTYTETDSVTCSTAATPSSDSGTRSELYTSDSRACQKTETLKLKMLQALKSKKNLCPQEKQLMKQLSATISKTDVYTSTTPGPRYAASAKRRSMSSGFTGSVKAPSLCSSSGIKARPKSACGDRLHSNNVKQRGQVSLEELRKKVRCIEEVISKLKREIANKERQRSIQPPPYIDEAISRLRKHLCCLQKKAKKLQREAECYDCISNCEKLRQQLCVAQLAIKRIKQELSGKKSEKNCDPGCKSTRSLSLEQLHKKLSRVQSAMIDIKKEICRRVDESRR